MLIYSGTKKQFGIDASSGAIADKINTLFWERGIEHDNDREYDSWRRSLIFMNDVLDTPQFSDDIQIAIEYQIPQTSKRVDFIIAGMNDEGTENAIIVELKQWKRAQRTSRQDIVKAFTGGEVKDVAHPSYQAYSYAQTISNFHADLQVHLHPCAYLHNYQAEYIGQITDPVYRPLINRAPLYISSDTEKLRAFIQRYVTRGGKRDILYEIDHGRIKPTKALQDALFSMLQGNEEFVMIDEQKVVFETVSKLIEKALKEERKFTFIVEGGPGTGKSVVAIQLLCALIRKAYNVQYVTKNAAPRNVYFEELRRNHFLNGYVKNLFRSSGSYINCPANTFDCLLVDEAHRLNEKSGLYGNLGENQIKEIISASKVNVFFIDEDQIVTTKDIGSIAEIKRCAAECGSYVYHNESTRLVSQFRCNGSDGYIAFLDDLLGIRETANWNGFEHNYDIQLFDSPSDMREALRIRNQVNNKARMLAGYCYEWVSRNKNTKNQPDIVLCDDFRAQWNFSSTSTWAIDKDSFDQVGCIHTSQGLEFDYVGVIIGRDLFYADDGTVKTDPYRRAKSDFSLRGWQKQGGYELADRIIRNTYRTLMTRGQKGCYIYCEDVKLQEYIRKRLTLLV